MLHHLDDLYHIPHMLHSSNILSIFSIVLGILDGISRVCHPHLGQWIGRLVSSCVRATIPGPGIIDDDDALLGRSKVTVLIAGSTVRPNSGTDLLDFERRA